MQFLPGLQTPVFHPLRRAFQPVGKEIHFIDFYESSGEGLPHYAKILKEKGYLYGNHYAPHDIEDDPNKRDLRSAIERGRQTPGERMANISVDDPAMQGLSGSPRKVVENANNNIKMLGDQVNDLLKGKGVAVTKSELAQSVLLLR